MVTPIPTLAYTTTGTVDYQWLWDNMVIREPASVKALAARIYQYKDRYQEVVTLWENIPWYVVGILHYRESNLDFSTHLANGDPLTERTVHEPMDLPVIGKPPFTWEEGAFAALLHDHMDEKDWSDLPAILYNMECYNGLGYQRNHRYETLSPYIWSGTNHYTQGKYTIDGKFSPYAVDKQVGAAPLMRYLTDETLGVVG